LINKYRSLPDTWKDVKRMLYFCNLEAFRHFCSTRAYRKSLYGDIAPVFNPGSGNLLQASAR
jgi:hypothetical protein